MIEKILNNTTPYGKIRSSHEGSLHSSTLKKYYDFYKNEFKEPENTHKHIRKLHD